MHLSTEFGPHPLKDVTASQMQRNAPNWLRAPNSQSEHRGGAPHRGACGTVDLVSTDE
ncbi:hypothetical protein GGD66_006922 [Bradyrhizobium sp. CIR48]|nr:hypothetical protein [Bradyrhizobium sp. CIR48]